MPGGVGGREGGWDGMRLLVGVANDEENGGSCGSHGWMERGGSWCSIKSQDHLSGGRMLGVCVCVYHPAVFSLYLPKSRALTCVYITRWRYMPLLVRVKPGYPCVCVCV